MFRALALASLALAASAVPGLAGWPSNPTNGNVALCTALNNQTGTASVPDGAGGAIVAWTDARAANQVYAQRVSSSGAPLWTSDGVALCPATSYQANASIASDGAGGAIVVWEDSRVSGNVEIFAQHVNATGTLLWGTAAKQLAANTGVIDSNPHVVTDGSGGAIFSWEDNRNGLHHDVYAQRVNGSGTTQWTSNGAPVCVVGLKANSVLASDGSGGAYFAWMDGRSFGFRPYAQRLNGSGVPQWTVNGVLVANGRFGVFTDVCADGSGVIVVWDDTTDSNNYDVYAQRLDSAGNLQWGSSGVAVAVAANLQYLPKVAPDGSSGAIVAWNDNRGSDYDIYAQRVSAAGTPLWTANGVPLCVASADQSGARLVSDGAGGAIVTWYDARNGTDLDIFARRIDGTGTPLWTLNGSAVCTTTLDQTNPSITTDGSGGAILAWEDSRSGAGSDIYAQWIDSNGNLGGAATGASMSAATSGLRLAAPSPNPARGATLLRYEIPGAALVHLEVYDVTGRRVRALASGERSAGMHAEPFDLRNDAGAPLSAGLYFVRLEVGDRTLTQRLVTLR